MLVVTRRIGEEIMLPDCGVTITVVSVAGSKVKLGVTAPAGVPVHRSEVLEDAGRVLPQAATADRPACGERVAPPVWTRRKDPFK